jgi:hypothetical protein
MLGVHHYQFLLSPKRILKVAEAFIADRPTIALVDIPVHLESDMVQVLNKKYHKMLDF